MYLFWHKYPTRRHLITEMYQHCGARRWVSAGKALQQSAASGGLQWFQWLQVEPRNLRKIEAEFETSKVHHVSVSTKQGNTKK